MFFDEFRIDEKYETPKKLKICDWCEKEHTGKYSVCNECIKEYEGKKEPSLQIVEIEEKQ